MQHGGRDENQDEAPERFHDIKQSTLCRCETKSNNNKGELLGGVVWEFVEEHVEAGWLLVAVRASSEGLT